MARDVKQATDAACHPPSTKLDDGLEYWGRTGGTRQTQLAQRRALR